MTHLNLSEYNLEGLVQGKPTTLYHGTTRSFKTFSLAKSRGELVNKFYGSGIFFTPSKRVASKYANANRNIGFDPSLIDALKKKNRRAGEFLNLLYKMGPDAWNVVSRDKLGLHPNEDYIEAVRKFAGGVDPNTLVDVAEYIIGSKEKPLRSGDGPLLFSMSTGVPDWVYKNLDEIGLDSKLWRPKIYTVEVTVKNPLVTASKAQARTARTKGYDSVIYFGPSLVDDVPEFAVFDPRNVKIKHVEVD